jgi:hypothetical protein
MCECENFTNSEEIVSLPHLKIYTNMSKYKIKESFIGRKTIFSGGRVVSWSLDKSQEELAQIFEEVNGGSAFIEKDGKTKTSNNEESSVKGKKKSDSKEKGDTEE